jgi:hypothetical protein
MVRSSSRAATPRTSAKARRCRGARPSFHWHAKGSRTPIYAGSIEGGVEAAGRQLLTCAVRAGFRASSQVHAVAARSGSWVKSRSSSAISIRATEETGSPPRTSRTASCLNSSVYCPRTRLSCRSPPKPILSDQRWRRSSGARSTNLVQMPSTAQPEESSHGLGLVRGRYRASASAEPTHHSSLDATEGFTRVTSRKNRVRESRMPGSVRAKPNGRATRPRSVLNWRSIKPAPIIAIIAIALGDTKHTSRWRRADG